jgi:hypothetical protein
MLTQRKTPQGDIAKQTPFSRPGVAHSLHNAMREETILQSSFIPANLDRHPEIERQK